jgi:APA family basic amino acid/polyamine antiporter
MAMVVSQVVGVGIFLTAATLVRTLGGVMPALAVWGVIGALSVAGALCYAELATRFPQAGGGYVFLREAFGPRVAFVYGWMSLLVTDPGITAALGIGYAQYLLSAIGRPASWGVPVAIAVVWAFGVPALLGLNTSGTILRWMAVAKLTIVGALVVAGVSYAVGRDVTSPELWGGGSNLQGLAAATMAAFFAFGGWWDLGRMAGEVESPRRTMPRALVGGVVLVATIYALVTVALVLVTGAHAVGSAGEALIAEVGAALFGGVAGRLIAVTVVIAVSGSLAATLFVSPRMYVAMADDGVFPRSIGRFDAERGAVPRATLVQMVLASGLIVLGTFDQVLGYFVPITVFFLGLSAAGLVRLPRPEDSPRVFRTPLYPVPLALFLVLIACVLFLFAVGQPRETFVGVAIAALGIPASGWLVPKISES